MLSDSDLVILLRDLESDRVERKASISDKNKIKEAICAFANDMPDYKLPGVIFIGVNDDGGCSGLSVTDELLRSIAGMRDDGNILPFPMMTVQKKILNGCEMAVVEVNPSYETPVRYNGRVWIRVGPRRAMATAPDERRLSEKRRTSDLPFDQKTMQGASLDVLDIESFKREYLPSAIAHEVLEQNQRSTEQQLLSLRFIDSNFTPNVSAVLVFGKDPLQWVPCAYIQFLRIDGKDLTDPILDQKTISGPLAEMLLQLDEVLKINISVSGDVSKGSTEIKQCDFPFAALQQLSRNAVMHRTYEHTNAPVRIYWFTDRIEISNPGGLYGQVNKENFGSGQTDYRNPSLSEAMKTLGFVQRFGMGIPLARKELQKNGNPVPEFSFEMNSVLVIVRKRL